LRISLELEVIEILPLIQDCIQAESFANEFAHLAPEFMPLRVGNAHQGSHCRGERAWISGRNGLMAL